jgi:hypothetical protein
MVTTEQVKPWYKYKGQPGWKRLEPGWCGFCYDDDLEYIQQHLMADPQLSYWWGWKPNGMKRRAEAAIRRVAYYGDPECRATNVKLVRQSTRRPNADTDTGSVSVSKVLPPPTPSHHYSRHPERASSAYRKAKDSWS